jgi:hypothetical protein
MSEDFERFLEGWLDDGPAPGADRVVRGVMERIATASQESPAVPWTDVGRSGWLRVRAAMILMLAVGGALYGGLASRRSARRRRPRPVRRSRPPRPARRR